MEEDLIAALLGNGAVNALVGVNIYWVKADDVVSKPYVILNRISGVRDTTMSGASGLVSSRVQVDCWADYYLDAKKVARAIEGALSGRRFRQGNTEFRGFFLVAERDGYDHSDTPDKLHGTSLDFTIWHRSA